MEVRLATPQDAEELLEIYRYYVEHLAAVDGHGKTLSLSGGC